MISLSAALSCLSGGLISDQSAGLQNDVDWSAWDGTNDSAAQDFFTAGDHYGPTHLASTASDEFVIMTRDRTGTQARQAATFSIAGDKTLSLEDTLDLSVIDSGVFPSLALQSSTRILGLWAGLTGGDFFLLGKSGVTLSEIATTNPAEFVDKSNSYRSIAHITGTKYLCFFDDNLGYQVMVVDTAGDSFSFGTPLAIGETGSRYGVLQVIDDTYFVVGVNDTMYLCDIGAMDALSIVDSELIVSAGTTFSDFTGSALTRGNQLVVIYEDGVTTDCQVFTIDTSAETITRGTSIEINSSSGTFAGPQEAGLVSPQDGVVIAAVTQSSVSGTNLFRISVAADGTLTSSGILKNVPGDHGTLRLMSGNALAVLTTQYNNGSNDVVRMMVLEP